MLGGVLSLYHSEVKTPTPNPSHPYGFVVACGVWKLKSHTILVFVAG